MVYCAKVKLHGKDAGKYIKVDLHLEYVRQNIRPDLVNYIIDHKEVDGGWSSVEVEKTKKKLDF